MPDEYGFDPLATAPAPEQKEKERIMVVQIYERCDHRDADIYLVDFGWVRQIERRVGNFTIKRR